MLRGSARYLVLLLLLSSCIAEKPNDLKVDRIEAIAAHEAGIKLREVTPSKSPDILKIDIETHRNLAQLASNYGSPIRFTMKYCRPWRNLAPKSGIRYPNPLTGEHGNIGGSRDGHGIFHYTIIAYISDHPGPYDNRLAYDLSTYPQDICISIFGGNETGFGYRSNEAVASSAQIMAAISSYRPLPPELYP